MQGLSATAAASPSPFTASSWIYGLRSSGKKQLWGSRRELGRTSLADPGVWFISRNYRGNYLRAQEKRKLSGKVVANLGAKHAQDLLPFCLSGLKADATLAAKVVYMFGEWYKPGSTLEYPIGGVGALVGALVRGLEKFGGKISSPEGYLLIHRAEAYIIEAALALGATPQQAIDDYIRQSLIRGLGPIFDHMKVSGLVTLPGAMTGMLMSGSHPLEAVKSSLVLLYMLVGASSLSVVIGAQLGWRSLFTSSLQLLQTL